MIHRILTKRYGDPCVFQAEHFVEETQSFVAYRWNSHDETRECILFMGEPEIPFSCVHSLPVLREIYGQAIGGFLLQGSMKVATLTTKKVYGLYAINELRERPEVQCALRLDPGVHFFMDASNVWFYGVKNRCLYEFDSEFQVLDNLGEVEQAIEELLDLWEDACPQTEPK